MNAIRIACVILWCLAQLVRPSVLLAQAPPITASVEPASADPLIDVVDRRNEVVRVGRDYFLKAGETSGEIAVIFGGATIEGHVNGDVVVVLGSASIASTAVIEGSLVVVGGDVKVADGAAVNNDLVVVGGGVDGSDRFSPGGEQVVLGLAGLGGRVQAVIPWVTRGLLWGRPVVPELPWIWKVIGVFFVVYLALNLAFDAAIRACAERLNEKPLSALVVGALVMLLAGPLCLLLAISIVGIAVVPFLLCALFVAGLLGKVAVVRWSGASLVRQDSPESRLQSLRSFAIGFAVIVVAYMIPLLGFAAFTLVGVFGIGASALAFMTAYRRENPVPEPPPVQPQRFVAATAADPAGASATSGIPSGFPDRIQEPSGTPAAVVADAVAFPRASFLDRLAAFALDVILVLIVRGVLNSDRDGVMGMLLLAYHVGFWTWKGTTVGGIICQLRVVRVDGSPLRFVDALVRGLSSIFSLAVAGIGCLWILRDAERQAWHDKIAGTYVVKVPRNFPL